MFDERNVFLKNRREPLTLNYGGVACVLGIHPPTPPRGVHIYIPLNNPHGLIFYVDRKAKVGEVFNPYGTSPVRWALHTVLDPDSSRPRILEAGKV